MLSPVPRTGVIYVTAEATAPDFARPPTVTLAGQPEKGRSTARRARDEITIAQRPEYARCAGCGGARGRGRPYTTYSGAGCLRYSAENVALSEAGGLHHAACAAIGQITSPLSRLHGVLGDTRIFRRSPTQPLGTLARYDFSLDELRREISGRGLGRSCSHSLNTTGKAILGPARGMGRDGTRGSTDAVLDEYTPTTSGVGKNADRAAATPRSQKDVIVISTVSPRLAYPAGVRLDAGAGDRGLASAASSRGGGSRPCSTRARGADADTLARAEAIRRNFGKTNMLLDGLRALGVRFEREPDGTFYAWGNLEQLPPPLDTGEGLFRAALEHKVIVVPGHFFDVDPGQRRVGRTSRFKHHARFSFGPSEAVMELALERLKTLVNSAR